ncbi:probable transcriptional regulator, LuxR family [Rhodococcus wratislaviensis]|uniref:Probable transcriptional regulator, LuxR family n=1 Tax=Rhodococcus wratislaviensis TaxID=44752 RepID=A0A402C5G8_RHOWR|nr:probable transcriptional regulator, LuxR family [Rhodococcus wratislaviensis]
MTHTVTPPRVTSCIPRSPAPERATTGRPAPRLSARELEVLLGWLACDSKETVAATLYVSLGTVNTHLSRIRDKYSMVGRPAPTKAALLARALQDGFLTIDELS